MAEMDNLSDIKENFDTIKTLLNSIRAQGILNTSDVDKLLTGINVKLEKLNTEEDLDLIKLNLNNLNNKLDERHSVVISKFGAVESVFTNLLKNNSEMLKGSEIKELFDIIATNLSVFSREVVSQKESLTDISLRIDAIRSDDSSKKEIIKNITLVKGDLDRLSHGFDTIVLSLNDNFKAVIKTMASFDRTDYLDKFQENLNSIETSSNTVLSALQLLDKKTEQVENVLKGLVTKDDVVYTNKQLMSLIAQSEELATSIEDLSSKYSKIDNLAEKIDASVNIVAGLKTVLEDSDNENTTKILQQLETLGNDISSLSVDDKYANLKSSIESIIQSSQDANSGNFVQMLKDLTTNTNILDKQINNAKSVISDLCDKNYTELISNIKDLSFSVSQIEDSAVSSNNAVFSNITDRLTIFENSLKLAIETQERTLNESSSQLVEKIDTIKNVSNVLDYKMDSSIVEVNNMKTEFGSLKNSIDSVLAIDFVNLMNDMRVDLYASKQDIVNVVENSDGVVVKEITQDIFGKYDSLISKMSLVEKEIKQSQAELISDLKKTTDSMASLIVDILSYVSEAKNPSLINYDEQFQELSDSIKDYNLSYLESMRDAINTLKLQLEAGYNAIQNENRVILDDIKNSVITSSEHLKNEVLEVSDKISEIHNSIYDLQKDNINISNSIQSVNDNILSNLEDTKSDVKNSILVATEGIKSDLVIKYDETSKGLISQTKDILTTSVNDIDSFISVSTENLVNNLSNSISNTENTLTKTFKEDLSTNSEIIKNSVIENQNQLSDELKSEIKSEIKEEIGLKAENSVKILSENINTNTENITNELKTAITENTEAVQNKIMENQKSVSASVKSEIKEEIGLKAENSVKILSENINTNAENITNELKTVITENTEAVQNKIMENQKSVSTSVKSEIKEAIISETSTVTQSIEKNISGIKSDILSTLKDAADDFKDNFANSNNNISQFKDEINSHSDAKINELSEKIYTDINSITNSVSNDIKKSLNTASADIMNNISDSTATTTSLISETIKTDLASCYKKLLDLEDCYKGIKSDINNNNQEYIAKYDTVTSTTDEIKSDFDTKFNDLKTELLDKITDFKEKLSSVQDTLSKVDENVDGDMERQLSIIGSNFESLVSQISIMFDKSDMTLSEILKEGFGNLSENVQSIMTNKLESYKSTIEKVFDNINNKNDEHGKFIQEKLIEFDTNMKSILETQASDNIAKIEDVSNSIKFMMEEDLKTKNLDYANFKNQLNEFIEAMSKQATLTVQNLTDSKNIMNTVFSEGIESVSASMEKETDIIIGELTEQFGLLKNSQQNDILTITSKIEEVINAGIYNNIEDLKSYLQKNNTSPKLLEDLDSLKSDVAKITQDLIENLNRMLDSDSFASAMSDFRLANELLINSATDRINDNLNNFVKNNFSEFSSELSGVSKIVEDKFALFDKKFVETLTDKYEELKLISSNYDKSFVMIEEEVKNIFSSFEIARNDISEKVDNLSQIILSNAQTTNGELKTLCDSFENLRTQISNRSFDEAFQTSINKQISNLENLVSEQFNYIQDINELCEINLPDIAEMNVIVKNSILNTVNEFSKKLDEQDIDSSLEKAVATLKTDIITQFLNIFNQISFVAEEEEIIDFIQEKHSDLMSVLGEIVTSTDKIIDIKEEIKLINNKISSIISTDGDVDYIYNLQDLETDIANLRLALNEINEKTYDEEIDKLLKSTEETYKLIEAIKKDLPNKNDLNNIAEDIESISTRTNKLILASDESYKILHDNLSDFKLVINDIDERTKNFSQSSGIDKINRKLETINDMVSSGAKTNQVFNQVFEYLAEWIDNAGTQIDAISNRVESLGEIGQIKDILINIKNGTEDNSSSDEMIGALESVFTKQTKRISAIETKLDRIIVETTLNNKVDLSPMENTLNKFLVAIDEKLLKQQDQIRRLESELLKVNDGSKNSAKKTTTKTKVTKK